MVVVGGRGADEKNHFGRILPIPVFALQMQYNQNGFNLNCYTVLAGRHAACDFIIQIYAYCQFVP